MRICFISYEYPPDTGIGGIATYISQITKSFADRQVDVEIICASPAREGSTRMNEYLQVTYIKCENTIKFRQLSPVVALALHQIKPFDLIEVPEYNAEGLYIKERLPEVTLIVKLHTPRYLIKYLNDYYYNQKFIRKIKNIFFPYNKYKDDEYKVIQLADYILSPSVSMKKLVMEKWNIPGEKILLAPNPYYPSADLLNITTQSNLQTIIYIGRLETRKGVYNLAKAIPAVIKKNPEARFIFLGKDSRGPYREKSMKQAMLKEIGSFSANVSFINHVPLPEVPDVLTKAAIAVFPSLWENFPNVCLEAMSAGLGIVASCKGGMKDMLEDTGYSTLIDPHNVSAISDCIIQLLNNPSERIKAGQKNRDKASSYYGDRLITELINMYRSFCKR